MKYLIIFDSSLIISYSSILPSARLCLPITGDRCNIRATCFRMRVTLQVDDLRKENRQLKRTIIKVHNRAEVMDDKLPGEQNLEAYSQSSENRSVEPVLTFTSRIHTSRLPKYSQSEVPRESFEIQEDTTNVNRSIHTHEIPEPILAIIEAREPTTQTSDSLNFQKLDHTTDLGLV